MMFPFSFRHSWPGAPVVWAAATRRLEPARALAALAHRPGHVRIVRGAPDRRTPRRLSQLAWRWTPTAEERLLAQAAAEPTVPPGGRAAPLPPPATPPSRRRSPRRRDRIHGAEDAEAASTPAPADIGRAGNERWTSRGLAWLPRARARQRRSRRADRDRLGDVASGRDSGAGQSDPAGRRSRSPAIVSTRRSSAASTRSSPAIG